MKRPRMPSALGNVFHLLRAACARSVLSCLYRVRHGDIFPKDLEDLEDEITNLDGFFVRKFWTHSSIPSYLTAVYSSLAKSSSLSAVH